MARGVTRADVAAARTSTAVVGHVLDDRLAAEGRRRGLTVLTATSGWDVECEAAVLKESLRLRVRRLCLARATERAMGCAGIPGGRLARPPLTTVAQPA